MNYKHNIKSIYKSQDTEEFIDKVFTKPIGYCFAKILMKLKFSANQTTGLSIIIGCIGASLLFFDNILFDVIAILLIIIANILDSTDGIIARITKSESEIGRIFDGVSTGTWYFLVYLSIIFRFFTRYFEYCTWYFLLVVILLTTLSGLCHQRQSLYTDYYRNLHLYFLDTKGKSELKTSDKIKNKNVQSKHKSRFKYFLLSGYYNYTKMQEKASPSVSLLIKKTINNKNKKNHVKDMFLKQSRKYIQLTNILQFNLRTIILFVCILLKYEIIFLLVEIILGSILMLFMKLSYEKIARKCLSYF